ncbi:MAG: AAA family ATPase [Bacteroidia bacterium]|nr:AAA family ATPase [Bacteroidia bacterium]
MSEKKDPSFVAYKFKHLLVYSSTEWLADGKKKYQRVFEASNTSYLYTEFAFFNKLFDENEWEVKVMLKGFELNGTEEKEVCKINITRKVEKHENIVFIREGWGNATKGGFWKKGHYIWRAYLEEVEVGSAKFYVIDGGPVTETTNPYLSISGVRLFEGTNLLPPVDKRTYYSQFKATDARYIWSELSLKNLKKDEDWYCEIVFNFYNDARQLKGRTEELMLIRKDQDSFVMASGWGSDHKGTWFKDKYTLEVVFMEQLIAVIPFEVADEYEEGDPKVLQSVAGAPIFTPPAREPETLEEVMAELEGLIGLASIKKKVKEYTQYLNFLKLRQEKGFDDSQKISLHAVFTGNPGTGKTTVAKLLGKIYEKMGLLSKGHVHEVDRSDLVGEYIGQTAPKVKEAIKKARGGILFIDEAYALYRSSEDNKDYGREVIEILIKEMSDGPGDLALLVAGYPKEMANFIESNPGLKSRFNMTYEFPDYVPQELMEIGKYSAEKRKVTLEPKASDFLYEKLVEAYRNRDRTFGNARYVNSLIEEGKMNMGLRVMQSTHPEELSDEALSTILLEDLEKIFGRADRLMADIPVDEVLLADSLLELKSMIGLNSVKNEINELVKLVKFYREIGKDVMNTFSLHTIFSGNPGTGKTTVARILARIYKALGILEKGHIIEVDRQRLVAGYIGQTAIKTSQMIDEAQGGLLFIDEAYALTQGFENDFGKEAVETILKRMEDQRGKFVVIAAGYPGNMEKFLESNPGLKSRFDKHLNFEDYSPDELYEIAMLMLKDEKLTPDAKAEAHLRQYFTFLYEHKDKFFGNARSVRKVVEETVKNQHLRLASLEPSQRTPEMLVELTYADVAEFKCDKDVLVSNHGRIGFGIPTGKPAHGGSEAESIPGQEPTQN